jgi:hypothetical protein
MTELKNGEPDPAASNSGSGSTGKRAASTATGAGDVSREDAASGAPPRRKPQFLIAGRQAPGASGADELHEALGRMEDVEIVRRLRPKGLKGLGAGAREIIVVRMDERHAEALRQSAQGQIVIEPDAPLHAGGPTLAGPGPGAPRRRQEIRFKVTGAGDKPLEGAGVTLFGRSFSAQALTDASGAASVAIFDAEADLEDVRAIYVQPAADHWECFVGQPMLASHEVNVVRLSPLPEAKSAPEANWARGAIGLDGLGASASGTGVKIALIGSGCDTGHPRLRHISRGLDLTGHGGAKGWTRDEIGQGTHCAGILAAGGGREPGLVPESEIHVFKLTPGGRFSDLIEALDQCIERQIDIVHVGVGADRISELVAVKIAEAALAGVACIAAAGDEGGPVQFPAMLTGVLAVSAITFSGSGPQVGVCAPGVAVISTAPGGGHAARDGTAVAAAHVAGLAAVVLAQHPLFRGAYRHRGEARVRALFELIASSATPPVYDPARVGAGLPDVRRVPGLGLAGADPWSRAAERFGAFPYATAGPFAASAGGEVFGERGAFAGIPHPAYLGGAMALMQLRAAGLI